eukprot:scaffold16.g17.t1
MPPLKEAMADAAVVPPVGSVGRNKFYTGRMTLLLYIGIAICMLLGFCYGYDMGVNGGVMAMKRCHFSNPLMQLVISTAYIASLPATFVAFWLVKRGRVLVISVGAAMYCVATGLLSGSQAAPVYMSEVALPRIRGVLVSFYQTAVVLGILAANLVNYGTGSLENGWRISLSVFAAAAVLVLVAAPFLPDSPDSLIARGKEEEAHRSMQAGVANCSSVLAHTQRIRGTADVAIEWEDTLAEAQMMEAMRRELKAQMTNQQTSFFGRLRSTLKWAYQYREDAVLTNVTHHWLLSPSPRAGNPLLLFYAPELFQTLGTSQNYSLLSAVVQGCFKVVGNLLCIVLVDRVGRKKLQVVGGVGQLLMQIAAALITSLWFDNAGVTDASAWALTSVLCLFEVFFELSICTLSWVIATEICPLEVRSIGAGFHTMGDLTLQIFFSQLTLTVMCALQYGVFVLSAVMCALFVLFSIFLIPETKGVPMEKNQELLRTHWLWRRFMVQAPASAKATPEPSFEYAVEK